MRRFALTWFADQRVVRFFGGLAVLGGPGGQQVAKKGNVAFAQSIQVVKTVVQAPFVDHGPQGAVQELAQFVVRDIGGELSRSFADLHNAPDDGVKRPAFVIDDRSAVGQADLVHVHDFQDLHAAYVRAVVGQGFDKDMEAAGGCFIGRYPLEGLLVMLVYPVKQFDQNRVFAGEIGIERAFGHLGVFYDIVNLDFIIPMPGEKHDRGVEDLAFHFPGVEFAPGKSLAGVSHAPFLA